MVTTRPPKTIVKPTALGPVANTDTKLLIYGLFQKGQVLAQDAVTCPWHGAASKGRETERECHHMRFVVTTGPVTNFGCRISGGISAYLTHVVSVFYFFLGSERSIVP